MTLVARARRSHSAWRLSFRIFILAANLCFLMIAAARPQTTQPVLFAVSTVNHQYSASTFLRDDIAGSLTLLNTSAPFKNPCTPQAIDAKGRFLFGACGDGLALYTFDAPSGTVAEIAASPFNASTGNTGTLIVAESTGQYVYLIKSATPNQEAQTLYLDTFQIDATTPALIPLNSQTLPVAGALVASAGDPNLHGMSLLLNQNSTGASYPSAILYTITFDPGTGAANLDPVGGQRIGDTARSMTISPTGNFLAIGLANQWALSTSTNSAARPSLSAIQSRTRWASNSHRFLSRLYFLQSQWRTSLRPGTARELHQRRFTLPDFRHRHAAAASLFAAPTLRGRLRLLPSRFAGPFAYTPNSSNGVNGISVYFIDPGTGLASQPAQNRRTVLSPIGGQPGPRALRPKRRPRYRWTRAHSQRGQPHLRGHRRRASSRPARHHSHQHWTRSRQPHLWQQHSATPSATAAATALLKPTGGTISTGYPTITMTDVTAGASIHFTTDGSTPTASSPLYSAPFTVNTSGTTIQAIATAPSYSASAVATASYEFQTPTATATGSAKQTHLSPITLILTVK
jgi:hypothetical protein